MAKRDIVSIVLAVFAGFLGGAAFTEIRASGAEVPAVIQARRFELLDESGAPISFWGHNDSKQVVLAFTTGDNVEVASFGEWETGSPFLKLSGKDGKTRAVLWLGEYDKPTFGMGDENWEGRVRFGFLRLHSLSPEEDEWGLVFNSPRHALPLARIRMRKNLEDGTISGEMIVRDATGKSWSAP